MSIEDLILRVWRDGAAERVVLQAGGGSEEDRVRRAAEGAALEEAADTAWPIDYRVLGADGRLWSVRIDRVTRPTCVAVAIAELPLVPATSRDRDTSPSNARAACRRPNNSQG